MTNPVGVKAAQGSAAAAKAQVQADLEAGLCKHCIMTIRGVDEGWLIGFAASRGYGFVYGTGQARSRGGRLPAERPAVIDAEELHEAFDLTGPLPGAATRRSPNPIRVVGVNRTNALVRAQLDRPGVQPWQVRRWAEDAGVPCNPHGRIPAHVIRAYAAAHPDPSEGVSHAEG